MLEKIPKRAAAPANDPWALEYSDDQWVKIEKELHHLRANPADLEKVRGQLARAARRYRNEVANAPRYKILEKQRARDWARTVKLSDGLMHLLPRLYWPEPPAPYGSPPPKPWWRDYQDTLRELNVFAGQLAAPKIDLDDGFPKAGPRVWFQFHVLENWTRLGGELKWSRNHKNKISGPLARYFSAATQPVLGGSLESLPDIVKRHKTMRLANNKRHVCQFMINLDPPLESDRSRRSIEAEGFAEVMASAAVLGLGDWAKQDDVQALLKEAIADWADQWVLHDNERGNGEDL